MSASLRIQSANKTNIYLIIYIKNNKGFVKLVRIICEI